MKKIISFFTVLCVLVCAFSSCGDTLQETYKVRFTGFIVTEYLNYDFVYYIGQLHEDEANYRENGTKTYTYVDENRVGETKEIDVYGKTYVFTYESSEDSKDYGYGKVNTYTCDSMTAKYSEDLGKCVYLYAFPRTGDAKVSEAEVLETAKEFLGTKTKYASEFVHVKTNDSYNARYCIDFERMVCGYKTGERISVFVNWDGTINGYELSEIGAFDGVDLSEIGTVLDAAIKEKADEIYNASVEYEGETYAIAGYRIVKSNIVIHRKAGGKFMADCLFETEINIPGLSADADDRMLLFIDFIE